MLFHRFTRLWRHRWSENAVTAAFPAQALQHFTELVRRSEMEHTGQIRICVEGGLPYSYIWRNANARERAIALFGKLRVWDTEANNGVLIYVLLAEKSIEIVADRGLMQVIPAEKWQHLLSNMQPAFREGAFAQGVEQAIEAIHLFMVEHFPRSGIPGHALPTDDGLPDAPVVQGRFRKS